MTIEIKWKGIRVNEFCLFVCLFWAYVLKIPPFRGATISSASEPCVASGQSFGERSLSLSAVWVLWEPVAPRPAPRHLVGA